MQTNLSAEFRGTPHGEEAESILRKCVHCGFCTATCPTYQLLGDELDGPRGRIYQIKQVLEGQRPTDETRLHMDRCLTCRSCETTCPSGVEYGKLLDIGRRVVEHGTRRPLFERMQRRALDFALSEPGRAGLLFGLARLARPALPGALKAKVPPAQKPMAVGEGSSGSRRMLLLAGCVQPVLTPRTNQALRRLLGAAGIRLVEAPGAGCCGALSHHLSHEEKAREQVRRNIEAWWPQVQQDAEAILVSASGCGVMVKDYGHFMQHDPELAERAARISELARDPVEIIDRVAADLDIRPRSARMAFHAPCTYQHGLRLGGTVEALLGRLGYRLTAVRDSHLCCGSAGTYSVLQQDLSQRLLSNKIAALESDRPELIATANVGCQTHLMSRSSVPVMHWLELLAEDLAGAG